MQIDYPTRPWEGRFRIAWRAGRRGAAALVLLLAGNALVLFGAALNRDRLSLRELVAMIPGNMVLRLTFQLHAALPHRVVQAAEGLLAGLGLGFLALAILLWTGRIRARVILGVLGTLLLAGPVVACGLIRNDPDGGIATFPSLSRGHRVEPVVSPKVPPAGGAHHPRWQNCGSYEQPLPNGLAIHSLEHGAIWIAYHPTLAPASVLALRNLIPREGYRLLSPYPELLSPIVVTAWGHQLLLDRADDPRLVDFIRRYERDPRGPEPHGPCTGGEGTPLNGTRREAVGTVRADTTFTSVR